MAKKPQAGGKPSRALADARAAVARPEAELARAEAAEETEDTPAEDEDKDDVEETPDAADLSEDDEESPEVSDEDEEEVDANTTDASAIAASAEAKAHPAMALAAIQSGQTLTQFRSNCEAAGKGGAGGRNQLASILNGGRRLGADAGSGGAPKVRSAAADYARNTAEGLKKHRR